MDHVCQRITRLTTLGYHALHCFPRIAISFHSWDNFNDSFYLFHILFNQLSFTSIFLLLLNKSLHSFFLILSNLLIFFPSKLFKSLLFLMRTLFIFGEILRDCSSKTLCLCNLPILQFAVCKWTKLKVIFSFFIEISFLFYIQKILKKLITKPSSSQDCLSTLFPL